jgi:hypothetical protein
VSELLSAPTTWILPKKSSAKADESSQKTRPESREDQTQTGDKGKCCPFAFCCLATLIDLLLILSAIWYDPSSEVIYALLNICSSEIQSCLNA